VHDYLFALKLFKEKAHKRVNFGLVGLFPDKSHNLTIPSVFNDATPGMDEDEKCYADRIRLGLSAVIPMPMLNESDLLENV